MAEENQLLTQTEMGERTEKIKINGKKVKRYLFRFRTVVDKMKIKLHQKQ